MLTVQDDWIQYEAVPARRVAVRGGAACAQRIPVASSAPVRPVLTVVGSTSTRPAARARSARRPLRLTRRGRFVLVVVPGLLALSGALVVLSGTGTAEAASAAPAPTRHADAVATIRSGDSLRAIAQRLAPREGPRAVGSAIQHEDGLHGSTIRPGAVLGVPVAG